MISKVDSTILSLLLMVFVVVFFVIKNGTQKEKKMGLSVLILFWDAWQIVLLIVYKHNRPYEGLLLKFQSLLLLAS